MENGYKRMCAVAVACLLLAGSAFAKDKYVAYLFAYFTGNSMEQEQICYAISTDGWNYAPLNDGHPVIISDSIARKKAVRDPHILRGEDGWFYMVVTDMASSQGWSSNRGMVLMRSRNLINWEHHTVHFPEKYKGTMFENVTRVWAPQTIFDKEAGKYMVYFSIRTNDGSCPYDRVYYAYANDDFSDLEGEPQVLFDVDDASIDTDIVQDDDGIYHVFYKTEGQNRKGIRQFVTPSLHDSDSWELLDGFCQDTREPVEGSGVFRLFDGTWVLMYDCYLNHHYQFCESKDLLTFKQVMNTKTSGKFTPRHGTVIAITQPELDLLMAWEKILIYEKNLRERAVPTLSIYQIEHRKEMLDEIHATLKEPASIKAYTAEERRIKEFMSK